MKKMIASFLTKVIYDAMASCLHSKKEIALQGMMHYLGLPYKWSGDDPLAGFDCSGLAIEYLQSTGILNNGQDFTAKQLYGMFLKVEKPERGDLVFFKNKYGIVIHMEIMLNSEQSIGASGGGSKVNTIDDAIVKNAYVKIRNVFQRSESIKGFTRPFQNQEEN